MDLRTILYYLGPYSPWGPIVAGIVSALAMLAAVGVVVAVILFATIP